MRQISDKFLIVEATDMMTGKKSYKIYPRKNSIVNQPILSGIPSRDIAETKVRELEEQQS